MAKYRQLQTDFWTDGFIQDLNPEEKYFYLFLLTNMSTTQCGIYELPKKYIAYWTGYDQCKVDTLLKTFENYGKIKYCVDTKEIILLNWIKYNLPNNCNAVKCINKEIKKVKHKQFIAMLFSQCMNLQLDTAAIFEGVDIPDVSPELPLQEELQPIPQSMDSPVSSRELYLIENPEAEAEQDSQSSSPDSNTDFENVTPEPSLDIFEAPYKPLGSKEITSNKEKEINNKQGVINNNNNCTLSIQALPVDNVDIVDNVNIHKNFKDVLMYFQDNIYKPGDWECKKLNDFVQAIGPEIVILAMDEAISNNAKKFRYIENILKRWIDRQLDTVEKVRDYNRLWKLNNCRGRQRAGSFNNFEQRDYDFQELERKLLGWDN